MSLFIETPQQEQLRLLREQREQLKHLRSMSEGAGVVGSAEDTSQMDTIATRPKIIRIRPGTELGEAGRFPFGKRVTEGFNSRTWAQAVRGSI